MKRFAFPFIMTLLLAPLGADGTAFVQPEFGRFTDKPAEAFFFPYPLDLSRSYLTLAYKSDISCYLHLEGSSEKAELVLPPLDGKHAYAMDVTPEYRPAFPLSKIKLYDTDGEPVPFSVSLTSDRDFKNPAPPADHGMILSSEEPLGGDYLLYRWTVGNNVLIFDFRDYETQDLYLKRLAFFSEKPGYRGTLMTNEEMEGLHGWNAHDYSKEGLASFFNLAKKENFSLNGEERELLHILLAQGILRFNGSEYLTGEGAIVSITRESSEVLRRRFLTHESLHGLFFTDVELRNAVRDYWRGMPDTYRDIWRFFMRNNFYDPHDEVLMYNEMLGYVLQLSRKEVQGYFVWRFSRIAEIHPEDAAYIENISPRLPEVMAGIYDQLEYIVSRQYPYSDGSFHEEGTAGN